MIKALSFDVYTPAGATIHGVLQPGGEVTYTALGIEADMGLRLSTPVLLAAFNLNDHLKNGKGISQASRDAFRQESPFPNFRFCQIYATENPDRRLKNKGAMFLSGTPTLLSDLYRTLAQVAADHSSQNKGDTALIVADHAVFSYQDILYCQPCDSSLSKYFDEQDPASFRSVLRRLKA